jgi:hydrogenase nickel incorporation protein HypA/HybF
MHELSVAESIIETVTRDATERGFGKVNRLSITIGELSMVNVDTLAFALEHLTKDTILEGASFNLEREEARGRCRTCGKDRKPTPPFFLCPVCGKGLASFSRGDGIHLDYYEGE